MAFLPWLFPERKESVNHRNLENWRYMTQSTEFLHKPLINILIWDSMRTLCSVKVSILLLMLTRCLLGIADLSLGPLFFRCDEEINLMKIWCRDYVSRKLRCSRFPSPFYNHHWRIWLRDLACAGRADICLRSERLFGSIVYILREKLFSVLYKH